MNTGILKSRLSLCAGSGLCVCHRPHGGVLVHGGSTAGGDGAAAHHPVPGARHHGVQRSKSGHTPHSQGSAVSVLLSSHLYDVNSGVHAVPEGHQHAVCGGADGGRGCGALEPPQTDRTQSSAAGRSAACPVSLEI